MRVLIIGAGAVGYHLAERLSGEAQEVTVVDPDPRKIRHVSENLDVLAIRGSGGAIPVLQQAGLSRSDIVVGVSGLDEVNLMACMAAARQGVPVKVARVRHPEHFAPDSLLPLSSLGVDLLIGPEQECAWEIFQLLATPATTDLARFADGRVQLVGLRIAPEAPMVGRSLAQLDQELAGRRFVFVALVREESTEIPTGSTMFQAGDKVFVLAPADEISSLPPLAGYAPFTLRRVMIAGGSDEAVYLARHLAEHRVASTILEVDRNRARELAEELPRSLILNGDATDLELLEMEGVEGVDGFVALTDRDEVNMLVALLAKSLGARRVIPLVHKTEYMALVEHVGLDAAVSPRLSAANAILRHIRRGHVTSVATVKGIKAEALEAVVDPESPLAGRRVEEVDFPRGSILGALVRDGRVVMPRGADIIRAGDHAIFFVLPEALDPIGRLLR
jgi:trk system potassium uptake protein